MNNMEADTINLAPLEKFIEAYADMDGNIGRIGILGDQTVRAEDTSSNAAIGLLHEFGTEKLPQRSFLRMPLTTKLQKALEQSGAFNKEALRNVVKEGSFQTYVRKILASGESVVLEAFATGGFGQWKPSDMKYKKVQQTLVETQQLRDSITSEVVSK
jgi:hypothetical protein